MCGVFIARSDNMSLIIKGRNIEITDKLRQYIEKKISKIEKHYNQIIKTEVELLIEKNPSISKNQTVQVTLFTKGPIFRARESSIDIYASIDLAVDKLKKQVERYKGKTYTSQIHPVDNTHFSKEPIKEFKEKFQIVKTKQFVMKPMTPEEAILQMETLGHSFFVFSNAETETINVIYRRKDNNYGLIEPKLG